MPQTRHVERHFTAGETVRDIVIGMSDGLTVPFALAAGAPVLPADAPGSASVRLGAPPLDKTPLDTWLEVLFGPQG